MAITVATRGRSWEHSADFIRGQRGRCSIDQNLLEEVHGLLDPAVQLAGPHDPARHGGQVPADGGVQLLLAVGAGHHVDVPAVLLQDVLVLLLHAEVWDAQSAMGERIQPL